MFGALNRFISVLDRSPEDSRNSSAGANGAFGFQVLRNNNQELRLEPWFDFIIGINGRTLDNGDPHLFSTEVRNSADSTISLGIWSAKGQRIREIYVRVPPNPSVLGLSLQWMPLSSTEDVWHILDVIPNSPADVAGLLPYGDYVIGSPEGLVRGEAGLGELVEERIEMPLTLYVYNHEYNVTRPVTITPSPNWGGQGLLGCTLGFGALHRIPAPLDEPVQAPGETMFDRTSLDEKSPTEFPPTHSPSAGDNGFGPAAMPSPPEPSVRGELLIPANMMTMSPSLSSQGGTRPPPKGGRKGRTHHHTVPMDEDIDSYFREGEEKSRKEEHGMSRKPGSPIPPPPTKSGNAAAATASVTPPPPMQTRSPAPVETGDSSDA